jgi:hypothetical protein
MFSVLLKLSIFVCVFRRKMKEVLSNKKYENLKLIFFLFFVFLNKTEKKKVKWPAKKCLKWPTAKPWVLFYFIFFNLLIFFSFFIYFVFFFELFFFDM